MLHACVQKFDVTGIVGNFLRTKQDLRIKMVLLFVAKLIIFIQLAGGYGSALVPPI